MAPRVCNRQDRWALDLQQHGANTSCLNGVRPSACAPVYCICKSFLGAGLLACSLRCYRTLLLLLFLRHFNHYGLPLLTIQVLVYESLEPSRRKQQLTRLLQLFVSEGQKVLIFVKQGVSPHSVAKQLTTQMGPSYKVKGPRLLVLHACVGQLHTVVLGKGRWTADAYAASMLWFSLCTGYFQH